MNNVCFENEIKEIRRFISSVNKVAYKDIYLIANPVLSKNPYASNYPDHFLNKYHPKNMSFHSKAWKLIRYYIKSFAHFGMYLLRFSIFYLSNIRFYFTRDDNEFILIDVFFMIEKINEAGHFRDIFFPGLEKLLINGKKNYAYLPFFYSSSYNKNPFEFQKCLAILKNRKIPMLTEYQLLSGRDLLRLFNFIIVYPFHVLKFVKRLTGGEYSVKLLKYELMDTIGDVTFYSFSRFLQGRRIAALPYKKIKIISWYENQPIDKYLYKGLKTNSRNRVNIYGAQLFIYSNRMLSLIPDENEMACGLLPDKIIVNGPRYIPEGTKLNYSVGPSLRYKKIFINTEKTKRENLLVLLPSTARETNGIFQMLRETKIDNGAIFIKPHPALPVRRKALEALGNVILVNKDIYELFEFSKIVIGAASGTLLEAVSSGIPVVLIRAADHFDYYNPLPMDGKGVIWEEVNTPEDLAYQIKRFGQILKDKSEEIEALADRYRKMFFYEVTDTNIMRAFDL